jgi:hypothetical protein
MDVALKTKEIGESKMGSTFIVAMAFETVVLAQIHIRPQLGGIVRIADFSFLRQGNSLNL